MQTIEPLEYGKFYHIYNHSVANRDLFIENDNYQYFMKLYKKYIPVVADTFAWVLMKNHFHFLIRIKDVNEFEINQASHLTGFRNLSGMKLIPHQQFSNLFNAYSKAINKRYQFRGTLFERPFKRKCITSENYLKKMVLYIHQNPVHHGFCQYVADYPWSSYLAFMSEKPTFLKSEKVLDWFDGDANFKFMHQKTINIEETDE